MTIKRLAALYDIHGNLSALDAVLEEVNQANVDAIVIGGDVLPGPLARECLERLRALRVPLHAIHGNGDREIMNFCAGNESSAIPELYRRSFRWNADSLDEEQRAWIASWPSTLRLEVEGRGQVFFCHATPHNDTDIFTKNTDAAVLQTVFDGVGDLAVCGHTHMSFDRQLPSLRIVNAGSVGMPFGETHACWLLIDQTLQFMKTPYDRDAAASMIRSSGYPLANEFASQNVLSTPSEDTMLQAFSRAEIRAA